MHLWKDARAVGGVTDDGIRQLTPPPLEEDREKEEEEGQRQVLYWYYIYIISISGVSTYNLQSSSESLFLGCVILHLAQTT